MSKDKTGDIEKLKYLIKDELQKMEGGGNDIGEKNKIYHGFLILLLKWLLDGNDYVELARKMEITGGYITQLKDKDKDITARVIYGLCSALNVTLDFFAVANLKLSFEENLRVANNLAEQRKKEVAFILTEKKKIQS